MRFCSVELETVEEIVKETATDFQAYYEAYCAQRNIDIKSLNDQHRERVRELYGRPPDTDCKDYDEPQIDGSINTSIVVHNSPSPVPTPDKEYQMTQDEKDIHEAFSKLFKKIALVLHPDRMNKSMPDSLRQDRINRFQEANRAMEEKKYFVLLDIADQFKITTPRNYEQQNRWMKREITTLEHHIETQKSTYNYKFAHTESDTERELLIRQFLYQVFLYEVTENS